MNNSKVSSFFAQGAEIALLFMAFSIPVSIAMVNIAFGFLVFFWLGRKVIDKNLLVIKTPLNALLLLFVLIVFLSINNTINIESSVGGLKKTLKQLLLFFSVVETLNNQRAIKRAVFGLLSGFILITFDGVFQFISGKDFIRGYSLHKGLQNLVTGESAPRITASMKGPNEFGSYLASVFPLAICIFLYTVKVKIKVFSGILLAAALFCLINTHYRGAAMGLVVSLIMFAVIKKDFRFIVFLIFLLLSAYFFLPKTIVEWSKANFNFLGFFVEEGGRRLHWQAALNMIKTHPFVGVGVNTFSLNYERFCIAGDPFAGFYAHNSYLHMAAEIGITGLLIFISMIAVVFKKTAGLLKKGKSSLLKNFHLGAYIGLATYLVAALLDSNLQSSNLTVLFWLLLGFLLSVDKVLETNLTFMDKEA